MPPVFDHKCNKCSFNLGSGWGGVMYVMDRTGARIVCPHPGEMWKIREVLGPHASRRDIAEQTGFNSDCICLDCLAKCELDLGLRERALTWRIFYFLTGQLNMKGRDPRRCPACGSSNVRSTLELRGKRCPKCGQGRIVQAFTGIWT